jgi:hypothetical protein
MPKKGNAQLELDIDVPNPDQEVPDNVTEDDQAAEVFLEEKDGETVATVVENSAPEEDKEEHEEYSDRVKKRIDKMTAKLREAERREKAALEYAQGVQAQLSQAQQRAHALDKNYVTEAAGRIKSQLAIVEANLQDAVERGDGKAAVEAQKMLAQLVIQQERVNQNAARAATQQSYPQPAATAYTQAMQKAAPTPSPKAEEWAEKNEWFGADQAMTYAAFGIHNQLKDEGFDLSSDEYYDELNRRIRKEFPQKFKRQQDNVQMNAPSVAPATRGQVSTGSNGRRSVKLTPSEVSMARRLGVPLEEYAKYVRR